MTKWIKNSIKKTSKTVGSYVERKSIRDFVKLYGLVYFGEVDHDEDPSREMVRGVTLSPKHKDKNLVIGNYKGYDVTLLQRIVQDKHPNHQSRQYRWSILQIDLKTTDLPHVVAVVKRDDELFFDNLDIKLNHLEKAHSSIFPNVNFAQKFSIYVDGTRFNDMPKVLTQNVMTAMEQYFSDFDLELVDDQLYIFTHQSRVSVSVLKEMLREAVWIAGQIDENKKSISERT